MDAPRLMAEYEEQICFCSDPAYCVRGGREGRFVLRQREATIPEVVAWLREQGAGKEFEVTMVEIAQGRGDKSYRVQTPIMVPPGDYLVIPVDAALSLTGTTNSVPIRTDLVVKTPTSQEGE